MTWQYTGDEALYRLLQENAEAIPLDTDENRLFRARVLLDGTALELADYAGCGKHWDWDEECLTEVWLPCETSRERE